MTTYDLDTLTLMNIGEETNDENRQDYSAQFLGYYNEAYFSICAGTLKPTTGQTVTLDPDRCFTPDALEKRLAPGGMMTVQMDRDFSPNLRFAEARQLAFFWMEDGKVAVPGARENESVYVTYRFLPDALRNDTPTAGGTGSEPDLLPEPYQGALAAYASAAFFRVRRKFERMQVWMETYFSAVQEMRSQADSSTLMLRNVYALQA